MFRMDCFAYIHAFLFVVAILFVTVSLIFINRSRHLKHKLSDMIETLGKKDKELDEARAANQNLLSPFLPETSRSIILSLSPQGKILDTNDYATEVFGYTKAEMIGQQAVGFIFPAQHCLNAQTDIISRIFANPKLYLEHETENIKKSGEHFWVSWTNRVIYNDSGEPTELRSVGFDITKRKQLEEELRFLTSTDALTGVLNRQAFLEAGMHELRRAVRYKRQMSVLVMKLDYFHSETNRQGFSDDLVRSVINICRTMIRDSDSIGRVGDVEFAIVLPETSVAKAMMLATRLKDRIQEQNLKANTGFFITATFGASEKESMTDTMDSILLRALNAIEQSAKTSVKPTVKAARKKRT